MIERKAPLPHIDKLKACCLILSALALAVASVQADDALRAQPSWGLPSESQVREQVLDWLAQHPSDDGLQQQAQSLWPAEGHDATAGELLARLESTLAIAYPPAQQLIAHCNQPAERPAWREFTWLTSQTTPPLVERNLRLVYGRWLAQQQFFDESLALLQDLKPEDVVDPATLLFYQAVVYYQLLHIDEAQEKLDTLLQRSPELPRRYQQLAQRMHEDLASLKVDSLDHIARRMDDVRRRLSLGRANHQVRQIEDGVIESLDKLIKKLEAQAQAQQQQTAQGAQPQSLRPAAESKIMEGKGSGKVDKKVIGSKSDWGSLPPKQREETLQQIGRQFPAHYRDVIEQYFKKLASESSE
jgi:tetratricopeptide (TPR) repeat protein